MKLRHFKSEQLKTLYNQWIIRTTLSLGIFIPAMAIILNSSIKEITFEFIVNQMLQSFYLGQVGFVLLSALYFGQEFLNHTIRTSLLCESNRIKFMLTKIVNLIIWEAICILVFTVVSIFI